jgi:hypothetical protein
MTTGALIFAFDNEQTDYVAMAGWCAENVHRHLDIPVAVVTDTPDKVRATAAIDRIIQAPAASGGTRWFEDYQSVVTWHNAGRVDAYSLSPWDRTLVLDADYVVASAALKTILEYDTDFMCYKTALNLATASPLSGLNVFGRHNLPMYWATVMMFRKSNAAQYIFDCMTMIRNNWQHYRDLYGIDKVTYRNDFALTIALGIVNGHTAQVDVMPWPLLTVMPDAELTQVETDHYKVTFKDSENRIRAMSWSGTDFHAMGKRHLGEIVASHC